MSRVQRLVAIPLAEYIDQHYDGNKAAFATAHGLLRQNVNKMIAAGFVMINDELYRPKGERGVTYVED